MGLFDKENKRGHNSSSKGFVSTPKPKPNAPTAQSDTLAKLSRSAAKQEAKKQNELAKAALVEDQKKLADISARGSLSLYSPEQFNYWVKKEENKDLLEKMVMHCIDYNNEDEKDPQVLQLEKEISLADHYDYLTAILGTDGKEVYDKFYLYLKATTSGHTKYTMGASTIMITGSKLDELFVDISHAIEEAEYNISSRSNITFLEDGSYTRPGLEGSRRLTSDYAWLREHELSPNLILDAKSKAMQELRDKIAPHGPNYAKSEYRVAFNEVATPYLRKWTMSPTNNVFFDLVDSVIDIACSEV